MVLVFRWVFCTLIAAGLFTGSCFSFSFSEYENQEAQSEEASKKTDLSQVSCSKALKRKKLAVMIGQRHRDKKSNKGFGRYYIYGADFSEEKFGTTKAVYGTLAETLNSGFRQLGPRTYTPAQINAQIARAEQEAFLNNNIDAAMSAANRLGADFMVKGQISTLAQVNKILNIDEIFVTITLSLTDRRGKFISSARISDTAFSDADVAGGIQKMVAEQSGEIIYQLFQGYCKKED